MSGEDAAAEAGSGGGGGTSGGDEDSGSEAPKDDAGNLGERDAGGGGGGGVPTNGVPLTAFPNFSTADNAAFVSGVVGEHDVVIYRAPAGSESWIGKGKLTVAKKGDGFTLELEAGNGEVVSAVDSTTAISSQLQPFIGMLFALNGNSVEQYLSTSYKMDGSIVGTAGGFSEVAFRNNIVAWGSEVPSLFAHAAGAYAGPSQALTCGQPEVTFELEDSGAASIAGTYNVSCGEGSSMRAWDGNDDYVAPLADGTYEALIDSALGGGSQTGGGITLRVDSWAEGALVTYAYANGDGSSGAISSGALVKN